LLNAGLVPVDKLEPQSRHGPTGENAGAGRRTDRRRRVTIGELQSLFDEAVNVRRAVPRMSVASEVGPAQVTDDDALDGRLIAYFWPSSNELAFQYCSESPG